jgi:group I intron endonuclease
MISGVYVIENNITGKVYIGSSQDVKRRWREHVAALKRGDHHSKYLQRSFDKHGHDAFLFRVLIQCDINNLLWYEQRAIDGFNSSNGKYGYNHSSVAGSRRGVRHPEEVRAKMRLAARNRAPQS